MCGNSTTSGRGKSGIVEGMAVTSRSEGRHREEALPRMLAADDLDGQVAVAGPVELRRDDGLELAEHQLALAHGEGQRVAEKRGLQVRVSVVAGAGGGGGGGVVAGW